jgi:hypothetical protein
MLEVVARWGPIDVLVITPLISVHPLRFPAEVVHGNQEISDPS